MYTTVTIRSKRRKIIQNQLPKVRLPNPLKAEAARLDGVVVFDSAEVVVVGGVAPVPKRARLLDEGPNAVPSVEKLVVDGESVASVGVEMIFPTAPVVVTLPTVPPLPPFEGEILAFTVPEIIPPPPLIPPDVVDDPPPPPTLPPVFCTIVRLLLEDKVPVTSEANTKEEEKNINISNKIDFDNIWCFMIVELDYIP
jgi:hypothetical protein